MRDAGAAIFAAVILIAVVLGILWVADSASCKARWADSGMKYRYGLVAGCQVQKEGSSKWLPEDVIRNVAE
jgi:hypothetical protein